MIALEILKWILIVVGIVLLSVLALVLLVLLLVLFVPFRYEAGIASTDIDGKMALYGFRLSWLYRGVSVRKKLDEDEIVIRILGIPIKRIGGERGFDGEDESHEEELIEDEAYEEDTEEDEGSIDEEVESSDEVSAPEYEIDDKTDEDIDTEDDKKSSTEVEKDKKRKNKKETKEDNDSDETFFERIISRIRSVIDNIKQKINDIFKKIDFIFFELSSIIDFVKDRANVMTVRRLLKEVVRIIRYVGPKKIKGHIEFGTSDPSTTGMILGGVSLIKAAYSKDVSITPNFDESCLIGDAWVYGRIRVVYFIRVALRVYFDKDVHRMIRRYRRMRKQIKKRANSK